MTRMQTRHALALAVALVVAATVPLPATAHANHVAVDPQVSPDGTVVVETAFAASDGFLVLHRDDGGEPGEPIGHVHVARSDGFRTDVEVFVDGDVWANWTTGTLWVVLHADDGDGTFDSEEDRAVPTFGRAAETHVTVAKGDRAIVTAIGDVPQRSDDATVTVRRAALPRDGQLLVRDASDGRILGRTNLSAGTHEQVDVGLDGSIAEGRDGLTLEAVVAGRDGDPVTAGDQLVATRFGVRFESDGTGTGVVETATATPNGGPPGALGQDGFGAWIAVVAITVALVAVTVGVPSRLWEV